MSACFFFFFLDTSLKLNISTPSLDLRSGHLPLATHIYIGSGTRF